MPQDPPEILVTITFQMTQKPTVAEQLEPVMRSAMAVGGKTTKIDITLVEEEP